MSKNTIIDGIAASEHLDSSGESLSIEGMDISSLGGPDSILNWEHGSKDRPTQVVGKVTFAKKLLKASDAKTKREKYFWNKSKKPMVYIKAELFDGVGHSGAQDVAAMLRYNNKDKGEDSRLVVGFSIEGGKIEKNGMTVTKSIARDVAITVKPCNKVCDAELIEEEVDENFLYKNENFDCEIFKNKQNSLNKSFRDVLLEDIKKGDVIKFPGSFNSEKTDQAIKEAQGIEQSSFMKNPDIHEAYKKPHFEALHARFEMTDDEPHLGNFKETLKNFHTDTHGEPYQNGDVHDIQWGNNHVYKEKGVWNAPFPVPTEIDVKKVGGVLGKGVETGSGPDPFMWMDRKYKTGLNALKAHKGLPLEINTRSDLIAHDQYIEHLDPKNHVINIHFMSDNDDINRKLEPGAPSVKRRMRAAKKLMDEGFKVNLIHNKLEHEGQNFEFNNHDEQESWKRLGGKLDSIKTVSQKIHPKSYDNIKKILGLDPIKKSLPAMESFKKQVDKFKETKSFKQKEDATKKMDTLMQQKIPQDPASKPKRKFTGDNTPTSFNFKKTFDIKNNMRKAIMAGMMGGSPDSKTGGAALAQEDLSGTLEKPFRSKSQRRFAYANKEKFGGEKGVKEWEEKTPKNIPEKVKKNVNYTHRRMFKNEKLEKMSKPLMINKELGLGQDPRSDVKTIDPEKTYTTKKGKTITAPELERKKIQQQYRNKEKEIAGLKPGYDFTPEAKKQIKRYQKQAYGKVVDPKTSLAVNINDPDYEINRSISFKQKDPVKNEMGNEIHETTHAFFSDIANKHGPEKAQKVNKHLLDTHFKSDDLDRIKNFVNSMYGEDYPHKDEEHVTHIWDVLNRPSKRKQFLEQHGHASKLTENSNASDRRLARMKDRALYKRLARGWNNSVKNIKNTEEMKKLLE